MPLPQTRPRPSKVAVLALNAALLMAPFSVLLSLATYVPDGERASLAVAAGLALGSIVLVAMHWRHLPKLIRLLGGLVFLMAGFSLLAIAERFVW